MAVRTITCIPGVTGDWQFAGGGANYSTGSAFDADPVVFGRTDLRPPHTRSLTMTRLGDTLLSAADPPVMALVVCGANPAASNPDQTFLRLMIPHHATAIVMADEQARNGADARLKSMAGSIVAAQGKELGQMQALLG